MREEGEGRERQRESNKVWEGRRTYTAYGKWKQETTNKIFPWTYKLDNYFAHTPRRHRQAIPPWTKCLYTSDTLQPTDPAAPPTRPPSPKQVNTVIHCLKESCSKHSCPVNFMATGMATRTNQLPSKVASRSLQPMSLGGCACEMFPRGSIPVALSSPGVG